eukprot:jgi/Mesvir1/18565/Mv17077-RA.2
MAATALSVGMDTGLRGAVHVGEKSFLTGAALPAAPCRLCKSRRIPAAVVPMAMAKPTPVATTTESGGTASRGIAPSSALDAARAKPVATDSVVPATLGVPVSKIRDEDGDVHVSVLPGTWANSKIPWNNLATMNYGNFVQELYKGNVSKLKMHTNLLNQTNKAAVTLSDGSERKVYFQDAYDMRELVGDIIATRQGSTLDVSWHRDRLNLPHIKMPALVGYLIPAIALGFPICSFIGGVRKGSSVLDMDTIREFSHSAADSRKEGMTGVTFADVAGVDKTLEELKEVVAFLKDPLRFKEVGAVPPRGLLLEGPPGTGKTLIAKAVAGEAGVPFFATPGSEFVQELVGVGAARVRDLFKRAKINKPCIIFVDEVDGLGGRRAPSMTGVSGGAEEREATLNQVLTEMDGFESDTGVIFIGATNRVDLLDPAIMRPGRFDRKIKVELPTLDGREAILRIHAKKMKLDASVDLREVAKMLPGFSGAELANMLNEAAVNTARRQVSAITMFDIYAAIERVTGGVNKIPLDPALPITRQITVQEAGHAVVATVLRLRGAELERVENVSLIPRGDMWSRTVYQRSGDEEYSVIANTKPRMMARLLVILAGRAAEHEVYGDANLSTCSLDDLEDATLMARRIIVKWVPTAACGCDDSYVVLWL